MRSDIAAGGTFPDYELPDQDRVSRRLSEIQGDDPMILTLARGHDCPKEHQQHLELAAFYPKTAVGPSVVDLWHDLREVSAEIRPDWDLGAPGLREAWEARDASVFHGWSKPGLAGVGGP